MVDLELRKVALGRNRGNVGAQLDNIVCLELIRRGFEVSVGKLDDKEIDFIYRSPRETLYVQVAYELPQNSKREMDNLLRIPDNYRKILITGNPMDSGVIEGIEIISVIVFFEVH